MEELRKRGNELFPTDPRAAVVMYREAIDLYDTLKDAAGVDSVAVKEEYTRCAGNALTCLFKLGQHEECAALAVKVQRVNPLIAKAYAFIGRCMLLGNFPSLPKRQYGIGPLQYLCRAVYLLPSMAESMRPFIGEALDKLLAEILPPKREGNDDGEQTIEEEPSIEVKEGDCGKSVVAVTRLPAHLAVSSTLHPFSVCSFDESCGVGVCYNCGIVCPLSESDEPKGTTQKDKYACGHCKLVGYCSAECAAKHRIQHDKYECRLLQRLKNMRDSLQASHEEREREGQVVSITDSVDEFFTTAVHCITTLSGVRVHRPGYNAVEHQLEGHPVEVAQSLGNLVRIVHELLDGEKEHGEVARLIGVIRCNAIEICDDSGLGVGQALHAASITSYFNHSCAPNCAIQSDAIVTTRVVEAGEELTIAYIPQLYWPTELRRGELAEKYFFHCRCVRCCCCCGGGSDDPYEAALTAMLRSGSNKGGIDGKKDSGDSVCDTHSKLIGDVQLLCGRVRSKDACDISRSDKDALQRLLQKCCAELYPFHYLCHELRNALTFVYTVLGDTRCCLQSCLDEFLLWESIVPGAHPVKRLKLLNALQCCEDLKDTGDNGGCNANVSAGCGGLTLLPHLQKLAQVYYL
ncbi:SET domain containing protein, putative [Trypanosoma equiperdum]|uniref:SET domain containing protein, putative n=1 Tax=Trypanosoma equiperdum TaxID=5694 RepID=A0A1G4HYI8_TRYEQ|nr:SET domain containing protein, putative [Trypanosoma equiperdum]